MSLPLFKLDVQLSCIQLSSTVIGVEFISRSLAPGL
jgi:hypothetical protein